jgi:hypothetical protein
MLKKRVIKRITTVSIAVIFLLSFVLDASARPRHQERQLSTFEQVVGGIILGGVLIKVFTTPSQPTIVPAPSPSTIDPNLTFGTYSGDTRVSAAEISKEFPRILRTLEEATYTPKAYTLEQEYMDLISRSGRSRVVVTTQRQSLSTVPDIQKGDVQKRLSDAGYSLLFLNRGEMQFTTTGGFQFFVYIVY